MLHSFGIKSDWNKNFATSNDINVHAKCKRWNAILIATSCAKQNSLHIEKNGVRKKKSTLDLLKENKCLQSDFNVNPIEFHVLIQEAMLLLLCTISATASCKFFILYIASLRFKRRKFSFLFFCFSFKRNWDN